MTDPGIHDAYTQVVAEITARRVETDIDPSTERISALMDLLGHPQRGFRVIHITGTNGKTSTARMIDALLRERHLRVGRYTSPHLRTARERIVIDGEPVSEERFVAAYNDIRPYLEMVDASHGVPMSFFEVLTGMAYALFADTPVDVAVVEVGIGGTWDATNVVDADVAVITPIDIDHTEFLPDTVEGIAEEKGGIIKPGSIAVLAQQPVPAAEALLRRAAEVGARVAREGLEFGVVHRELAVGGQQISLKGLRGGYDDLFLPVFGAYQAGNAAVAVAAVEAFAAPGEHDDRLDPELVAAALSGVESPGRMEVVRTTPTVLVDAAHNPAGMRAAVETLLEEFGFVRLVGVVAIMADKDVEGILEPLEPVLDEVVVTRNSSPRSLAPADLAAVAEPVFGPDRVHRADRLDDAIDQAIALAEAEGQPTGTGVIITGSVVTAGDAVHLIKGE
ncbi:bifunctional folylpolyglutamate synthase/dihydrofolate synthase [Streptomonospora sp. S1-112]|uniref:Dihydrofolate synthase/folylpolyglutamate synthase n=1 Tax=Streptomonospora mangrovi TaxID=2883123 RepID=A0A9X3NMV7_9ACTN|nr:folylpolyglutamate synthase/dihydrofolate synthase family protein [Streptomonospora mangrovi]MDA0564946.1 bifunctional folylpolyglutamate synthase/dihydrofolate synthase [Streptomonospora mangrovi]